MSTVADLLTELVQSAVIAAGHGEVPVPAEPAVPTADPRHGDYQSNHAFRIAKAIRANPRAVADAVVKALPAHPAVAAAEVAGPGFINFRLDDRWLGAELSRRAADDRFGAPTPGAGRSLVIDYSSPNIAKRMHVGHMRSTLIGNALHRMFQFLGWTVIADNHVGDWGTQFGKLIVAWRSWRDESAFEADPVGELQRLYQLFGDKAKGRPELEDEARAETVKLQDGDPDNRALWQRFVDVSMAEFDQVYARLGVSFDVTLGESYYRDRLGPMVDDLLARGVATISEGAVVVPFTEEDGKDVAGSPLLIRKRDGASLYGTTDIATVMHRVETWNPDVMVYVTDVRQQLHFKQVFAACRKIGLDRDFRHVWFGLLRFADGNVAATRTGQVINLVDVIHESIRRARAVVDEHSPELPEDERQAIAEAVGPSAVRYADLSQNPQSDIVFEWDKMLSLQGNTAPYLMYAYARCCSVLAKAGADVDGAEPGTILPEHPVERALCLQLLQLPDAIATAANTARPNLLAEHIYEISGRFASFWAECPVLQAEEPVRTSRIGLVVATARAMRLGLRLLGLAALDRM